LPPSSIIAYFISFLQASLHQMFRVHHSGPGYYFATPRRLSGKLGILFTIIAVIVKITPQIFAWGRAG
jgi:predicted permease